ncbi:hypothetical protein ACFL0Q_06075, partial [Thermodesulfobacteriota bacterium]
RSLTPQQAAGNVLAVAVHAHWLWTPHDGRQEACFAPEIPFEKMTREGYCRRRGEMPLLPNDCGSALSALCPGMIQGTDRWMRS